VGAALGAPAYVVGRSASRRWYTTLHLGKWHLGGPGNLPEDHGFDVNIGGSIRGLPRSYHFPYGGEAMKWRSDLPESQREGRYLTDRLADEAVSLIEHTKDKPFFLYFSFYAVHAPVQGRPDLVEQYKQRPSGERHRNPEYAQPGRRVAPTAILES
jgi:arylsulfatase A-like enzyme